MVLYGALAQRFQAINRLDKLMAINENIPKKEKIDKISLVKNCDEFLCFINKEMKNGEEHDILYISNKYGLPFQNYKNEIDNDENKKNILRLDLNDRSGIFAGTMNGKILDMLVTKYSVETKDDNDNILSDEYLKFAFLVCNQTNSNDVKLVFTSVEYEEVDGDYYFNYNNSLGSSNNVGCSFSSTYNLYDEEIKLYYSSKNNCYIYKAYNELIFLVKKNTKYEKFYLRFNNDDILQMNISKNSNKDTILFTFMHDPEYIYELDIEKVINDGENHIFNLINNKFKENNKSFDWFTIYTANNTEDWVNYYSYGMNFDSSEQEENYENQARNVVNYAFSSIVYTFKVDNKIFYVRYYGGVFYKDLEKPNKLSTLSFIIDNQLTQIFEDDNKIFIVNENNKVYIISKYEFLKNDSVEFKQFDTIELDNTVNSIISNNLFLIAHKNEINGSNIELYKLINFPDLKINYADVEIDHNNNYFLNINCRLAHELNIHNHASDYLIDLQINSVHSQMLFPEVPLTRNIYVPMDKEFLKTSSVYLSMAPIEYQVIDRNINFGISNIQVPFTKDDLLSKIDVKNFYYLNGSLYFRMRFLNYLQSFNMLTYINDTNSDEKEEVNNKFILLSYAYSAYLRHLYDNTNYLLTYKDNQSTKRYALTYSKSSNTLPILDYDSARMYKCDLTNLENSVVYYDLENNRESKDKTNYYKVTFKDITTEGDLDSYLIVSTIVYYKLLKFRELYSNTIYLGLNSVDYNTSGYSDINSFKLVNLYYKTSNNDIVDSDLNLMSVLSHNNEDFVYYKYRNLSDDENYVKVDLNKIIIPESFPTPEDPVIYYKYMIPYPSSNNKQLVSLTANISKNNEEPIDIEQSFEFFNEYMTFDIILEDSNTDLNYFLIKNLYEDIYVLYNYFNRNTDLDEIKLQRVYNNFNNIHKKYVWLQFDNVNLEGLLKHPRIYFNTSFLINETRIYSPDESGYYIDIDEIVVLDDDETVYKTPEGDIKTITNKYVTDNLDYFYDNLEDENSEYPKEDYIKDLLEPFYIKTFNRDEISKLHINYEGELPNGVINSDSTYGEIMFSCSTEEYTKENNIVTNLYIDGKKIFKNYFSQKDNLNGSINVYLPMTNLCEYLGKIDSSKIKFASSEFKENPNDIDARNRITNILDKHTITLELNRRRIAETNKVLTSYTIRDMDDRNLIITNGLSIPLKISDNLENKDLRLCVLFKEGIYTKRLNSNKYSIKINRDYNIVNVKLNGLNYCDVGDTIIIINAGIDSDIKFYDKIDNDNLDCIALANYLKNEEDDSLYIVETEVDKSDDIEVVVDGLMLYPNIDYTIVDIPDEDIPKLLLFKNVIPNTSKLEINILNKDSNHCVYFATTAYDMNTDMKTPNILRLYNDKYIFNEYKKFMIFVNNKLVLPKYYEVLDPLTLKFTDDFVAMNKDGIYNILVRFNYDDHTHNEPIFDYYKYYQFEKSSDGSIFKSFGTDEDGNNIYHFNTSDSKVFVMSDKNAYYHCEYGDTRPSDYDILTNNNKSGSGIKLKLLEKKNYIINCNNKDELMFDCVLNDNFDIINQYIGKDIIVNANITDDELLYEIDTEGTLYINKKLCNDNHFRRIITPNIVNGIIVKRIKEGTFRRLETVEYIEFATENYIESIDSRTFEYLNNVTKIVLPNGIKEVKRFTIKDCPNLETIVIPKSVEILDDAFYINCPKVKNIIRE